MEINWVEFGVIAFPVSILAAFIVWKEHEVGIRLGWGSLRTWFSWLVDGVGVPPFCPHVKMRMGCGFCPFLVREKQSYGVLTYCGIVWSKP